MPTLELRTKQSLALTPRLQQSVRLLQLSSLEFQQELRNALDTNPFLEYDESQTEDNALSNDNGSSMTEATPAAANDAGEAPLVAEVAADTADSGDSSSHDDSMSEFSSDPFGRFGVAQQRRRRGLATRRNGCASSRRCTRRCTTRCASTRSTIATAQWRD